MKKEICKKLKLHFRFLLAMANKKENDEDALKYYSMDFSNFKNQWMELNTNLLKNPGNHRQKCFQS